MTSIRTALVGFGISGQCFQAPIIESVDGLDLVAVVSTNPDKVNTFLPGAKVFPNLETLLSDCDAELVVIATPNDLHYPMAKLALEANRHVVIEKPFVIDSEDGEELIELAKQKDRLLSVYQSRRFDGDFLTIQHLKNCNQLGDIHTFYSSYNRYRPEVKDRWREQDLPGAGILYDLGAHLIDQALILFGMPDSVMAHLRNQRPGAQAVDHFHLVLSYPDTEVILHGNCLSTAPGPRFQVFGTKGTYIKFGMDSQEDDLRQNKGPWSTNWGLDPVEHYGLLTDSNGHEQPLKTFKGGYEAFYQLIASAIQHGTPLPVEPSDALDVIRVIEAAYQSEQRGCRIELSRSPT